MASSRQTRLFEVVVADSDLSQVVSNREGYAKNKSRELVNPWKAFQTTETLQKLVDTALFMSICEQLMLVWLAWRLEGPRRGYLAVEDVEAFEDPRFTGEVEAQSAKTNAILIGAKYYQ